MPLHSEIILEDDMYYVVLIEMGIAMWKSIGHSTEQMAKETLSRLNILGVEVPNDKQYSTNGELE